MAKTEAAAAVTAETIGGRLRGVLNALKRPVASAVEKFSEGRESVQKIAPKVIGLFNAIKADHASFSFVEFCRMFDASVPTHAADRDNVGGYRTHKTYYTLDYMRRLTTQRPRGRQGVRDTATDALARTIATILAMVGDDANRVAAVWDALQKEMGYNERVMGRLRARVEKTEPFFVVNLPRGASVKIGNVIHMERTAGQNAAQGAAEGEPLRQPGRRVKRAA